MNTPPNPTIDVVVRARNEMPHTREMLARTLRQSGVRPRILFMDEGSTDGSREAADALGVRIVDVGPAPEMPGVVLNRAMMLTSTEIVAFLDADCVPLERGALRALVAPLFEDERVAATYGRQIAWPSADPLVALEYAHMFGDAPPRIRHGAFFSMAASAIRRAAWSAQPFDSRVRYSEDVEWATRVAAGRGAEASTEIRYVPDARFQHAHDDDVRAQYERRRGEGRAEATLHRLGPPTLFDLLAPLGGALVRDARANALSARGVVTRLAQAAGYYQGRRDAVEIRRVA